MDNSKLIIVTDVEEDGDEHGSSVTQITSDAFFTNSMRNAKSLVLLASGEDRLTGFNGKAIEKIYIDGTSFAAPKVTNIAIKNLLKNGYSIQNLLNELKTNARLITHNYGEDIIISPKYSALQTSFTYTDAIKISSSINISPTDILDIIIELVPNAQPTNKFTNYLFTVLDSPKGPWNLDGTKDNIFEIPGGRASYYFYYSNFPIQMKILKNDGSVEYIPISVQQIINAGLYQIFEYPQVSTASIKIEKLASVSALYVEVKTPTPIPTPTSTAIPTSTPTPTKIATQTSTPQPTSNPVNPTLNLLQFLPAIFYNRN